MLPFRDVIPAPTRPVLTVVLLLVLSASVAGERAGAALAVGHALCLWIYGPALEDRMGRARLLVLVAAGAALGAVAAAMSGLPGVPSSAAAAVAGVIAAYLARYPSSPVLAWVPVPPWVVELPSPVLVPPWIGLQLLAGVSPWALAAGSVAGLAGTRVLRRPDRDRVEWWGR